ncbi:MAG: hypothetical protein KBF49_08050, partial [Flavobacteriales bacterium]|nr:hypothetical protein [Flavobacteriales bacterium]
MKLLQRTALYQALLALPMIVVGTAIGYGLVRHTVTHELDEALADHAAQLRERMHKTDLFLEITTPDMLVKVAPGTILSEQFSDTVMYDTLAVEDIPWRIGRF